MVDLSRSGHSASRRWREDSVAATLISEEFVGSIVTLFLEAPTEVEFKVQVQERALADLDLMLWREGCSILSWDPSQPPTI